jgi:hypothetical protein
VKYFLSVFIYFILFIGRIVAQDQAVSPDSLNHQQPEAARTTDTVKKLPAPVVRKQKKPDSVVNAAPVVPPAISNEVVAPKEVQINQDSINAIRAKERMSLVQDVLKKNGSYKLFARPVRLNMDIRKEKSDDGMFYFLVGLIFYFALIRLFFGKYLDNLVSIFFRVTMRHQQIREQMLQTPLPSLLLNILFVISASLYSAFIIQHYGFSPFNSVWPMFGYCILAVTLIYLAKFLFLKITGWIFNASAATDTYIFIVFLVNKMIGIFLLPVLVLLAFPKSIIYSAAITLSYVLLVLLFFYRFFISYRPVRNEIKINRFHFFIYLCAFEIAPLLLIYKVLLDFVERST